MEERNLRLTREKADLASSLTELEEELAEVLCFIRYLFTIRLLTVVTCFTLYSRCAGDAAVQGERGGGDDGPDHDPGPVPHHPDPGVREEQAEGAVRRALPEVGQQ